MHERDSTGKFLGFKQPSWRQYAAKLATKPDPITIEELDELFSIGFEPTPSPAMNLEEDDIFHDARGHAMTIMCLSRSVRSEHYTQWGYDEDPRYETFITPGFFYKKAEELRETAAFILLAVGFIGNQYREQRLADAVGTLVQKIQGRIEAGKIDKTDGHRPSELL
jgi:hypothetical protein